MGRRYYDVSLLPLVNANAFAFSMAVNVCAALGLIGSGSIPDISHKHETVLTPADFAFSIWSIIYSLRAGLVLFHLLPRSLSAPPSAKWRELWATRGFLPLAWVGEAFWMIAYCNEYFRTATVLLCGVWLMLAESYYRVNKRTDYNIWANGLGARTKQRLVDFSLTHLQTSMNFAWITCATVISLHSLSPAFLPKFSLETSAPYFLMLAFSAAFYALYQHYDIAFASTVAWGLLGIAAKTESSSVFQAASTGFLVLVFTIAKKSYNWYNKFIVTTPAFITKTKEAATLLVAPPKWPVTATVTAGEEEVRETKPSSQETATRTAETETTKQTPLELFQSVADTLLLDDNSPVTYSDNNLLDMESEAPRAPPSTPTATATTTPTTSTTTLSSDHTEQPTNLNAANAPITLSAPGDTDNMVPSSTLITTYTIPEDIADNSTTTSTAPKALRIVNMPQTALPAASTATTDADTVSEKLAEISSTSEPPRIMPSQ